MNKIFEALIVDIIAVGTIDVVVVVIIIIVINTIHFI
jgi:hypothetical protein